MTDAHYNRLVAARAARARAEGRPLRVPHEPVLEHLKKLRDAGMTIQAIADQATENGFQVAQSTLSIIGRTSKVHRATADAVFSIDPDEVLPTPTRMIHIIGAQRAIGGLVLRGFSMNWITTYVIGHSDLNGRNCYANNIILGRSRKRGAKGERTIEYQMFERLWAGARKYETVDPEDVGISLNRINAAKNYAKKMGFVPLSCWDDDTINDPDAHPEWTGACGTLEGYRIHLREEIAMCDPCAKAGGSRTGEAYDAVFSASALRELMEEKGFTVTSLAEAIGYSRDTVQRIAWSQRNPLPKHIKAMAEVLGVTPGALAFGAGEDIIYDDDFKGAMLRVIMDERGLSYQQLGRDTGFSHTSFHKWVNGSVVPRIPNIQKLATHLGVDWKVFYS